MLRTVIIENNEQTKNLLQSYLKNIKEVELLADFNDFKEFLSTDLIQKEIDLIIFDINSNNADGVLEKVKTLKTKHKKLNFIAMSYEINSELVSKTLKEEVRDFILKPLIPEILQASIKKVLDIKNNVSFNLSKAICVFSPKGGVGKTTFAQNLAFEIANAVEENVCLLDLNFSKGDIATYLNLKPKFDLSYILSNLESSDKDLLLSLMNNLESKNAKNLYVLSENSSKLKLTPNEITKVINSLKNIFPYIIIDLNNEIDEETISVLNSADLILLMATLSLASIRNCQKSLEAFNEIGYNPNKIKLIVNRFVQTSGQTSDITIKDIEYTLKKEVFYKIPNNYLTLVDAINLGEFVGSTNPQSNIARAYKNIASEILSLDFSQTETDSKYKYNHGIFNLLRRMGE